MADKHHPLKKHVKIDTRGKGQRTTDHHRQNRVMRLHKLNCVSCLVTSCYQSLRHCYSNRVHLYLDITHCKKTVSLPVKGCWSRKRKSRTSLSFRNYTEVHLYQTVFFCFLQFLTKIEIVFTFIAVLLGCVEHFLLPWPLRYINALYLLVPSTDPIPPTPDGGNTEFYNKTNKELCGSVVSIWYPFH